MFTVLSLTVLGSIRYPVEEFSAGNETAVINSDHTKVKFIDYTETYECVKSVHEEIC